MRRWGGGRGWVSLALFALIAVSLLGAVVLIYQTVDAERRAREQARKTSAILLELRNVGRAAINAETGQRGYFITLDRRYLEPYRIGRAQYRPALDRIERLIGSQTTPRQRELLAEIRASAEAKFAEIDESLSLIERSELIAAQRLMLSDVGQQAMNRLRRNLREMEKIEQATLAASSAYAARAEARILPMLASLFVLLLLSLGFGFWQTARAARAEAAEAHAAEIGKARDRADLLARELNHRVKNLFAVILAIVRMSARSEPETRLETKEAIERIAQRIHALLIAHEVTQGSHGHPVAELRVLVETTLAPHRSDQARCTIAGPETVLGRTQVTPLGLVLHELATNAVKYGAWRQGGTLEIRWHHAQDGRQVVLEWREFCPEGYQPPTQEGFGSQLMHGAARQLKGSIVREFGKDGVSVRIAFPIGEADAMA